MPNDALTRFLAAVGPAHRADVEKRPRAEQEQLAAAWEKELAEDTDLDTLTELSPAAGEAEAARRVLERTAR